MDKKKTSKKALRNLINDSMVQAISTLELPQPTKKVKKLLYRNAKKLAVIFSDIIRRDEKRRKKAAKTLEASINGKKKKKVKERRIKTIDPVHV